MTDEHVVAIREGENRVAVRRNELVLGHFRLSVWAQRLFLILVAHVDQRTTPDTVFRFEIVELARWLGIARQNLYTDLVPAIFELENTKLEVARLDGKPGVVWLGLIQNRQVFSASSRDRAMRAADGVLMFRIYEELLPFVKELSSRFTVTELRYALRLRSSFSQKIYDLLKANHWRGRSFELDMTELRGLLAIAPEEYGKFSDFRRNILEMVEREICQKTDIRFTWDGVKAGNRIVAIRFTYSERAGDDIEFLPETRDDKLLQRLAKAGVKAETAADLVRLYGDSDPSRIVWALDEALRQHRAGKIKTTPAAWITSAIREDWRPQRPLFAARERIADDERSGIDGEAALGAGFAERLKKIELARRQASR